MNSNQVRRALRRLFAFSALLLIISFCVQMPASAKDKKKEKDYALIFGTVWTPKAQPAYGVTVKIRRADKKKAKWILMSDHNGEFAQRVPAGTADYIVWAEVPHQKSPAAETKVHIDNDERVDIGLHLTE